MLTESQIFEDEALSGTKSRDNPAEEMPQRCDHGENLTRTLRIDLIAKALIPRVHKVLTNDTLDRVDWNAELERGDLEKAVQQLKRESGKGLFASGVKLPQALAELRLIDE